MLSDSSFNFSYALTLQSVIIFATCLERYALINQSNCSVEVGGLVSIETVCWVGGKVKH